MDNTKRNKPVHVTEEHTLKYSDVDRERKVTLTSITRWFQDIFLKQDKLIGADKKEGYVWILLNYDLNIYKYPKFSEEVVVETYPYSFTRFYGNRIYLLKNKNGEVLAEAKTKWILLEGDGMKITRLKAEVAETYGIDEISKGKGFEVDSIDNEIFEGVRGKELEVRYHDIDLNDHVNNTVYFSYVYDSVDKEINERYDIYKIQILYKNGVTLSSNPKIYAVTRKEEDNQLYSYIKIENEKVLYTTIKVLWKHKE